MTRKEIVEKALLTDEEIKKKINEFGWILTPVKLTDLTCQFKETAKAQLDKLLDLYYPCKDCGGSGQNIKPEVKNGIKLHWATKCSTCKGTGKGEKMIAVLD